MKEDIIIHLNNGEQAFVSTMTLSGNEETLARQISECPLVNAVDWQEKRFRNGELEHNGT